MTLEIPIKSPLVQEYVEEHREDVDFLDQINNLIETQLIIKDIKGALDEAELFKQGKIELQDAREFLNELENED